MADRRSITEGLKATPNAAPVDPLAAREFIHGVKTSTPGATGSNPGHAGAIHFYIHAMEASTKPEKALPFARELGKQMPGAGHMVHYAMPGLVAELVGAVSARSAGTPRPTRFAAAVD